MSGNNKRELSKKVATARAIDRTAEVQKSLRSERTNDLFEGQYFEDQAELERTEQGLTKPVISRKRYSLNNEEQEGETSSRDRNGDRSDDDNKAFSSTSYIPSLQSKPRQGEVNIGMIGGMINVDAYESSKIPLKLRNFENRQ